MNKTIPAAILFLLFMLSGNADDHIKQKMNERLGVLERLIEMKIDLQESKKQLIKVRAELEEKDRELVKLKKKYTEKDRELAELRTYLNDNFISQFDQTMNAVMMNDSISEYKQRIRDENDSVLSGNSGENSDNGKNKVPDTQEKEKNFFLKLITFNF